MWECLKLNLLVSDLDERPNVSNKSERREFALEQYNN